MMPLLRHTAFFQSLAFLTQFSSALYGLRAVQHHHLFLSQGCWKKLIFLNLPFSAIARPPINWPSWRTCHTLSQPAAFGHSIPVGVSVLRVCVCVPARFLQALSPSTRPSLPFLAQFKSRIAQSSPFQSSKPLVQTHFETPAACHRSISSLH